MTYKNIIKLIINQKITLQPLIAFQEDGIKRQGPPNISREGFVLQTGLFTRGFIEHLKKIAGLRE